MEISRRLRPPNRGGRQICVAFNMPSAGCVAAGFVSLGMLLFGGQAVTSQQSPPAAAAERTRVAWLIFVDDLHLDFVATGRLRDVLRTAASALGEGSALVGLRSSGPSMVFLAPSADHVARNDAIRRIVGNALRPSDFLIGTALGSSRELRYRAHTSLSALHSAVASLASVATAKKHVLYISNGFAVVERDPSATPLSSAGHSPVKFVDDVELRDELARVAQVSVETGISISALDPRPYLPSGQELHTVHPDLWQRFVDASHRTLRELTTPTGGDLLDAGQPLNDALSKLLARVRG